MNSVKLWCFDGGLMEELGKNRPNDDVVVDDIWQGILVCAGGGGAGWVEPFLCKFWD